MRVVVTGASRGIGRELVRAYRLHGGRVFAACRRPTHAIATEGAEPLVLDIASIDSIDAFVAELTKRTDGIDRLIHNAGIPNAGGWTASEGFGSLELAAMESVMRTNAFGPLLLTEAAWSLLESGERPIVAGVSSLFSSFTHCERYAWCLGYSISKISLNMWLRSLAFLHPEVRTVALDPGWVRTNMGDPDVPLAPRDVAAGLVRVLNGLTDDPSGSYLAWDGVPVPW